MVEILLGQTLRFIADPFSSSPDESISYDAHGAVAIEAGKIIATGTALEIKAAYPAATITDYSDKLIMAGFVDCHVHFPQSEIIASYGTQLIEWLNKYTFPAEMKYGDAAYAAKGAEFFVAENLRNGTTSASVYCTVHPQSAEALFTEAAKFDMALAAGKVMMDRNAPDGLKDTAQTGYDESKALIEKWHGKGRARYAVTPRFAPTSTPEQLEASGALWAENPTCLMQTHVSENLAEIDWVAELFPDAADYMGVYEKFGLIGKGANFGHAIHLKPREIDLLRESGSSLSHCPTSNMFIGSGLFDMAGLRGGDGPILTGLATDTGGGSSYSMFATMRCAYEVAQLRGHALHPSKAFYLATVGSAQVMNMGAEIGNLATGYCADMIVIDLESRPLIRHRMNTVNDIWETLFVQMILADDRAIYATYIAGQKVHQRQETL